MITTDASATHREGAPLVRIAVPHERLADFCRRTLIRRLALFGSVLRDDFSPASDVDVLVEFEPEARIGLMTVARIEIELTHLLGRNVEVHTVKGLNPRFRDAVLAQALWEYERA